MTDFDFDDLYIQAVAFEAAHGKDKGNGWRLKHPIKKLALYKEYLLEQQRRK